MIDSSAPLPIVPSSPQPFRLLALNDQQLGALIHTVDFKIGTMSTSVLSGNLEWKRNPNDTYVVENQAIWKSPTIADIARRLCRVTLERIKFRTINQLMLNERRDLRNQPLSINSDMIEVGTCIANSDVPNFTSLATVCINNKKVRADYSNDDIGRLAWKINIRMSFNDTPNPPPNAPTIAPCYIWSAQSPTLDCVGIPCGYLHVLRNLPQGVVETDPPTRAWERSPFTNYKRPTTRQKSAYKKDSNKSVKDLRSILDVKSTTNAPDHPVVIQNRSPVKTVTNSPAPMKKVVRADVEEIVTKICVLAMRKDEAARTKKDQDAIRAATFPHHGQRQTAFDVFFETYLLDKNNDNPHLGVPRRNAKRRLSHQQVEAPAPSPTMRIQVETEERQELLQKE